MSKEMENRLLPKLRFREFIPLGDWQQQTLGELANFRRGSFPQPYGLPEWYDKNGLPFIQVFDVADNFKLKTRTKNNISSLGAKQSVFIPKGTLIITIQGSIGRVAITQYDAYVDRTLLLFEDFVKPVSKLFFAYGLFLLFEIEKLKAPGGIIKTITKEVLSDFKLYIPELQEQQKIADCLSSLDDLISAESEKLEALKEHKKGLMQQLFPAEGEKVPKLRFPAFKDSGEWEEKELIKLADKKVRWSFIGGPFGSNLKASDYTHSGIRIIQLQNIGEGLFLDKYKIFTSEEKADELLSNNIYSGDIILSKMGDPVGRACIIPDNLKRAVMASDGIRFVVDERYYEKYFVFTLINSDKTREVIDKRATGSTRKRIGLDELKQIPLLIPPSKDEQKKISELIFSLDSQIAFNENRVIDLKLHKKGLMQGLFPNVN